MKWLGGGLLAALLLTTPALGQAATIYPLSLTLLYMQGVGLDALGQIASSHESHPMTTVATTLTVDDTGRASIAAGIPFASDLVPGPLTIGEGTLAGHLSFSPAPARITFGSTLDQISLIQLTSPSFGGNPLPPLGPENWTVIAVDCCTSRDLWFGTYTLGAPVPGPGSWVLIGLGLLPLALRKRA